MALSAPSFRCAGKGSARRRDLYVERPIGLRGLCWHQQTLETLPDLYKSRANQLFLR